MTSPSTLSAAPCSRLVQEVPINKIRLLGQPTKCDDRLMKKVLLIEDDVRLKETLSLLLSPQFKVQTADSVAEATKLASSNRFDAIISDFVLNDGDGFSMLNFINKIQPRPKLFFITAYAEKDMAIKLLNEKIDGFIEKPFEFSHLLNLLEKELFQEPVIGPSRMRLIPYEKMLVLRNNSISLTEVEFKILSYLLSQKNVWVSREDLIEYIWGESIQSRNILDTHLSNLKKKIPTFKDDLKVVRGRGYLYSPIE